MMNIRRDHQQQLVQQEQQYLDINLFIASEEMKFLKNFVVAIIFLVCTLEIMKRILARLTYVSPSSSVSRTSRIGRRTATP